MSATGSHSFDTSRKAQQRCRGVGAAALLDKLAVDAFRQDAFHMRRRPRVGPMHGLGEQPIQFPLAPRMLPQERRRQIFQRPREQRVLHALEHELGFHVRERHGFLRAGVRF